MKDYKIEISALDYARLSQMNYGQSNKEISDMVPDYIHMGYGYYGSRLAVIDGKYYAIANIGDSCD